MLLVDPLKRITIPEIRQHFWFTQRLPRYLAVMQVGAALLDPACLFKSCFLHGCCTAQWLACGS